MTVNTPSRASDQEGLQIRRRPTIGLSLDSPQLGALGRREMTRSGSRRRRIRRCRGRSIFEQKEDGEACLLEALAREISESPGYRTKSHPTRMSRLCLLHIPNWGTRHTLGWIFAAGFISIRFRVA